MDAGGLFRNYAVDIVLLPPPEVMDAAIQINRMLIEMTGDDAIRLDTVEHIPHVSLAMGGCMPGSALSQLNVPLEQLANRLLPMEVGIEGAVTVVTDSGDRVSGINLAKEDAVFLLHRSVMAQLSAFSKEKCSAASFVRDEDEQLTPPLRLAMCRSTGRRQGLSGIHRILLWGMAMSRRLKTCRSCRIGPPFPPLRYAIWAITAPAGQCSGVNVQGGEKGSDRGG
ncbi:hypothetical protein [Methanogenium cariaci]|uniref:hypothetical protein n=1 Tax=Methanogenium cariaci TaxID=2197 RepID=UPI000785B7A4|nr:hypothetical protein [Methanogenium cariaci]